MTTDLNTNSNYQFEKLSNSNQNTDNYNLFFYFPSSLTPDISSESPTNEQTSVNPDEQHFALKLTSTVEAFNDKPILLDLKVSLYKRKFNFIKQLYICECNIKWRKRPHEYFQKKLNKLL